MMAPSRNSEESGEYLGMQGTVEAIGSQSGDLRDYHYTDLSLWDVHRTQLPLLSLIQPRVFEDTLSSLRDMARTGGDVPRWVLANVYTGCMIGNHVLATVAEAVLKGHGRVDFQGLYEAGWLSVSEPRAHAGRSHVEDYLRLGYVPLEDAHNAASLTLAYSFDDWSVAVLADHFQNTTRADLLRNRSQTAYRSLFSTKRELMCPRTKAGELKCPPIPFLPYPLNSDFTEGSALIYLWFVPHDPVGLVNLFPSKEAFVKKLDGFMQDSLPKSQGGKWPFGNVLANGWYWAGNEPDLLAPWLFNFAGAQHLTAKWTTYLATQAYTSGADGVPGNDDYGALSAWLVWAVLGLYPLPATNQFILGMPQVEQVTVGNLTISRFGPATRIAGVALNGKNVTSPFLVTYQDLMEPSATLQVWTAPAMEVLV